MFEIIFKVFDQIKSPINDIDLNKITVVFIVLMISIFASLIGWYIYRSIKSVKNLKTTKNGILEICESINDYPEKVANHIKAENLYKFTNISNETAQFSQYIVNIEDKLYATQDVDTICNALWWPSILKSRILPAGPAVLTGIGVLGTFLGLLLGLGGLQLDGDLSNLQKDMKQVSGGASVAFATSVCGVFLSLLLMSFEKIILSWVNKNYDSLKSLIKIIFPHISYATIFIAQKNYAKSSSETIGRLSEEIGQNFQKTIDTARDKIIENFSEVLNNNAENIAKILNSGLGESLQKTLIPAVEELAQTSKELAERQANANVEALQKLLGEFTGRFSEQGDKQREAMATAQKGLEDILAGFKGKLMELMTELNEQQSMLAKAQKDMHDELKISMNTMTQTHIDHLHNAGQSLENSISCIEQKFGNILGDLNSFIDNIEKLQDNTNEQHIKNIEEMRNQFEEAHKVQEDIIVHIAQLTSKQIDACENVIKQAKLLQECVDDGVAESKKVIASLIDISKSFEDSASDIYVFKNTLKEGIDSQHNFIDEQRKIVTMLSQAMDRTSNNLENVIRNFEKLPESLKSTVAEIAVIIETQNEIFENLDEFKNEFGDELSGKINELTRLVGQQLDVIKQFSISVRNDIDHLMADIQSRTHIMMDDIIRKMTNQSDTLDEKMGEQMSKFAHSISTLVSNLAIQWNDQIKVFCDNMVTVTQAMGELVDNLDNSQNPSN